MLSREIYCSISCPCRHPQYWLTFRCHRIDFQANCVASPRSDRAVVNAAVIVRVEDLFEPLLEKFKIILRFSLHEAGIRNLLVDVHCLERGLQRSKVVDILVLQIRGKLDFLHVQTVWEQHIHKLAGDDSFSTFWGSAATSRSPISGNHAWTNCPASRLSQSHELPFFSLPKSVKSNLAHVHYNHSLNLQRFSLLRSHKILSKKRRGTSPPVDYRVLLLSEVETNTFHALANLEVLATGLSTLVTFIAWRQKMSLSTCATNPAEDPT